MQNRCDTQHSTNLKDNYFNEAGLHYVYSVEVYILLCGIMPKTCVYVCLCRVFIPNYISKVKVQLVNCSTKNKSSDSCPVVLKIRARAPPVHNSSALDCREGNPCELVTLVPAWEQWYYILVERYLSNSDVYFRIGVQVTGECDAFLPYFLANVNFSCL